MVNKTILIRAMWVLESNPIRTGQAMSGHQFITQRTHRGENMQSPHRIATNMNRTQNLLIPAHKQPRSGQHTATKSIFTWYAPWVHINKS